jgi:hypothetical protein
MRSLVTSTIAALAFASAASATPAGPYHEDHNGACLAANGHFVGHRLCERPPGATALCGDGTWSFAHRRENACSRQAGVDQWYG